jgi:precorrin-6Y C5,15-methyltransferase (decarboxylating)
MPDDVSIPKPWLTLIGIGEEGRDGLSPAARGALRAARLVVGGRRHLAMLGPAEVETLAWPSPIESALPLIIARRPDPVAVLASGDPFWFGIGSVLCRHIPIAEMTCLPQPSSFSLAAARLGWALQECRLMSFCGRPIATLVPALQPGTRILALSADATTPAKVASLLTERGFGRSMLTLCEALGGPRERLRQAPAADCAWLGVEPLNLLAIDVVAAEAGCALAQTVPGRPDAAFEQDGQITKSGIRAVTLSKLRPLRGECLWDVGAGSGSVGIEWMLADPFNRAVAIECRADRAGRIRRNADRLGVPGLDIVQGEAPQAYAGLPRPDAVFIGGGATSPGVVEGARAALRPGGRLVVNAVTIETQGLLIDLFKRHGGHLSSLQIAEADQIGGFHGWRPSMPVTQWVLDGT